VDKLPIQVEEAVLEEATSSFWITPFTTPKCTFSSSSYISSSLLSSPISSYLIFTSLHFHSPSLQRRQQNPHCPRGLRSKTRKQRGTKRRKRSEKASFYQIHRSGRCLGKGCSLQSGRGKEFQQIFVICTKFCRLVYSTNSEKNNIFCIVKLTIYVTKVLPTQQQSSNIAIYKLCSARVFMLRRSDAGTQDAAQKHAHAAGITHLFCTC